MFLSGAWDGAGREKAACKAALPPESALASPVLLTHISCVRGSPLIRTFLILAALVVSGIGFARLTQKGATVSGEPGVEVSQHTESDRIPAKVHLTLAHLSGFYDLTVGEERVPLSRGGKGELVGTVSIDPDNPVVFLKVSCLAKTPNDGQRFFAKLVVEAEGEETFTHVFDADGDIDDFVELPF